MLLKEKPVLNYLKYFAFLYLFSYNSNCQEQKISGTYKLYEGSEGSYKYYSFNDAGYFEFHEGGCLGEFSYGKGNYEIKNDSIYFYYKKYSDQVKYQSHQVFKYRNDSKKIKLSVNVFDQDSIPLEGANVYFQERSASIEHKGGMVNHKGNILLEKDKTDEVFKINISHLGYKPQKIYLYPSYNYVINTFLKKKTIKGESIKDKVVKFKLIEIDDNFFKVENNGNIEKWYKSKL